MTTDEINAVYRERNQLVAALSKVFPSYLTLDPDEPDWTVVVLDLPTGQAAWHVHRDEMVFFQHLEPAPNAWDGHTTEEKYERLARLERMWS